MSLAKSRRMPIKASSVLRAVNTINSRLHDVVTDDFRRRAFLPQLPLLITTDRPADNPLNIEPSLPATAKWFTFVPKDGETGDYSTRLQQHFLEPHGRTILPYELITTLRDVDKLAAFHDVLKDDRQTSDIDLPSHTGNSESFHSFNAPLDLFLKAARSGWAAVDEGSSDTVYPISRLYIAQAQIRDLPRQLQEDLPTPHIVLSAGKGDIYDANIWLGIPPTYTPLHKDPNPNLFVQLGGKKVVRLFTPEIGSAIFRDVQYKIGGAASAAFRGDEMMQGPERKTLEDAVWNCLEGTDGFEVIVGPNDALFIPKGWWHSIKSLGTDVTGSVNWWFR